MTSFYYSSQRCANTPSLFGSSLKYFVKGKTSSFLVRELVGEIYLIVF